MEKTCNACGQVFRPAFVFQIAVTAGDGGGSHLFARMPQGRPRCGRRSGAKGSRRVAILNQKGGTGKTTTAVNLAAGLAERHHEVLLIDTDAQGNVGVSLGVAGERAPITGSSPGGADGGRGAGALASGRDHVGCDARRCRDIACASERRPC